MKKLEINKDQFLEFYNKGLNDSQIGRELNVNHVTIRNYRMSINLPSIFKYKSKINHDRFLELYKEGLNDVQISKEFGLSNKRIQEYRSNLNLSHNFNLYEYKELSYEQEQIVIGAILGDSHFSRIYKNATGEFIHSIKQEEYCIWKRSFLSEYCSEIKYSQQFDKRTNKVYKKVICYIHTNPVFNPYYDLFYKNKIKIISKELLYRLEGLGIAVWFMDDGYKHKSTNSYCLSTNCFSLEDLEIVKEFFLKKFNIKMTIHKSRVMYVLRESRLTFKKLIEPYIINSMRYKL